MLQIGISGSIGSGKTTVCRLFELLGIPIYYSDWEAKKLMHSDGAVRKKIVTLFGKDIYTSEGELDRKKLAGIVFNDKSSLDQLNQIVHPAVALHSKHWFEKQKAPYAIKEAALLVEIGAHKLLDKLIIVHADLEVRINRVTQRDQVSKEAVLARESKQLSPSEKIKFADFVIDNNGDKSLVRQVLVVHNKLIKQINEQANKV